MAVTVPVNPTGLGTSAQQSGNKYFGWEDIFLPGFNLLNNMFDFTGTQAAQSQYNSQLGLNQQAQDFNSAEAEKQREWQEYMSSTEMQRRVKDLEAAGLNPYLALGSLGGSGTSSGSSASSSSGSADMANNKLTAAAGIIAVILRMIFAKH